MNGSTTNTTRWHVNPGNADQPAHPHSLIRVFAIHVILAYDPYFLQVDHKHWLDWADAQADLSLCWACMSFSWFCLALAQIIWFILSRAGVLYESYWEGFSTSALFFACQLWDNLANKLDNVSVNRKRKTTWSWMQMSPLMRKHVFGSFQPGQTQTGLLSYRS